MLPFLKGNGGDDVIEFEQQGRRGGYGDGWRRSVGPVSRCRPRLSYKLIHVTLAVGLGRMIRRVKMRVEHLASFLIRV